MATIPKLSEIGDEGEDAEVVLAQLLLSSVASAAPLPPSDGSAEGSDREWWEDLLLFFLARDSSDDGDLAFLDLENLVVDATMSRSLRT